MIAGSEREAERTAEAALHGVGISGARVIAHGDVARVVVPAAAFVRATEPGERENVVALVRAAGFRYVALDLADAEGDADGR